MVILEEISHAQSRGAKIYGEIIGYGRSSSAYHLYDPHPEGIGMFTAINQAIREAEIEKTEIDYINVDGIGTIKNDQAETKGLKNCFGKPIYQIPISSTKSMTGHMGTASGAAELIFCVLALEKGVLPPTINYENPDPDCDLDYIPNQARKKDVEIVLSTNQGLGGQSSALIIKKFSH